MRSRKGESPLRKTGTHGSSARRRSFPVSSVDPSGLSPYCWLSCRDYVALAFAVSTASALIRFTGSSSGLSTSTKNCRPFPGAIVIVNRTPATSKPSPDLQPIRFRCRALFTTTVPFRAMETKSPIVPKLLYINRLALFDTAVFKP